MRTGAATNRCLGADGLKPRFLSFTLTGLIGAEAPRGGAAVEESAEDECGRLAGAATAEAMALFTLDECRDLIQTCLTRQLRGLIRRMTGLRLQVSWHRPKDSRDLGNGPVACPTARRRSGVIGRQPKRCEHCLNCHWHPALSRRGSQGRWFVGRCGVNNFVACLHVDNLCLLTLVLQAGKCSGESDSLAEVDDAAALARLILHDLESTAQARLASYRLDNARRKWEEAQVAAGRLGAAIFHEPPVLSEVRDHPGLDGCDGNLVASICHFVHQHFHRPIGLSDVASAMGMNGSYLSSLFSQTTGVTFHRYLEEVRLAKAKELLRDPRNRVGEVARTVGYASPDAFRHAFKRHENRSPETWRAG